MELNPFLMLIVVIIVLGIGFGVLGIVMSTADSIADCKTLDLYGFNTKFDGGIFNKRCLVELNGVMAYSHHLDIQYLITQKIGGGFG